MSNPNPEALRRIAIRLYERMHELALERQRLKIQYESCIEALWRTAPDYAPSAPAAAGE